MIDVARKALKQLTDGLTSIFYADTDNFVKLCRLARLNPKTDYRGVNLSGCDFSDCKLAGFDFSRCTMLGITWNHRTDFTGAIVEGAVFDPAALQIKGLGR